MNIGIIGKGFVGSAVEHGFSCNSKFKAIIRVYDKNPILSTHSLSETINHSEIIFLVNYSILTHLGSLKLYFLFLF